MGQFAVLEGPVSIKPVLELLVEEAVAADAPGEIENRQYHEQLYSWERQLWEESRLRTLRAKLRHGDGVREALSPQPLPRQRGIVATHSAGGVRVKSEAGDGPRGLREHDGVGGEAGEEEEEEEEVDEEAAEDAEDFLRRVNTIAVSVPPSQRPNGQAGGAAVSSAAAASDSSRARKTRKDGVGDDNGDVTERDEPPQKPPEPHRERPKLQKDILSSVRAGGTAFMVVDTEQFFQFDGNLRMDPGRFAESAPLVLHFFLHTPSLVVEHDIIAPLRTKVKALRRRLQFLVLADAVRYGNLTHLMAPLSLRKRGNATLSFWHQVENVDGDATRRMTLEALAAEVAVTSADTSRAQSASARQEATLAKPPSYQAGFQSARHTDVGEQQKKMRPPPPPSSPSSSPSSLAPSIDWHNALDTDARVAWNFLLHFTPRAPPTLFGLLPWNSQTIVKGHYVGLSASDSDEKADHGATVGESSAEAELRLTEKEKKREHEGDEDASSTESSTAFLLTPDLIAELKKKVEEWAATHDQGVTTLTADDPAKDASSSFPSGATRNGPQSRDKDGDKHANKDENKKHSIRNSAYAHHQHRHYEHDGSHALRDPQTFTALEQHIERLRAVHAPRARPHRRFQASRRARLLLTERKAGSLGRKRTVATTMAPTTTRETTDTLTRRGTGRGPLPPHPRRPFRLGRHVAVAVSATATGTIIFSPPASCQATRTGRPTPVMSLAQIFPTTATWFAPSRITPSRGWRLR